MYHKFCHITKCLAWKHYLFFSLFIRNLFKQVIFEDLLIKSSKVTSYVDNVRWNLESRTAMNACEVVKVPWCHLDTLQHTVMYSWVCWCCSCLTSQYQCYRQVMCQSSAQLTLNLKCSPLTLVNFLFCHHVYHLLLYCYSIFITIVIITKLGLSAHWSLMLF